MSEQGGWGAGIAARIGQRVAELRAQRGLSAQQLSDRLSRSGHEINRASLSQLENGRRGVSVPDLLALAWALDTSPLMLLVDPEDGDDFPYFPPGDHPFKTIDFVDWWSGIAWPERSGAPTEGRPGPFLESVEPLADWREYIAQDERRWQLLSELGDAWAAQLQVASPEARDQSERVIKALEAAVLDARAKSQRALIDLPWLQSTMWQKYADDDAYLERVARARARTSDGSAEDNDGDG